MKTSADTTHVSPAKRPMSATARSIEATVVMLKVGIIIVGWLAVFLMTFLGYLTLPAIVLFAFLVIYTVLDFVHRKTRKASTPR